MVLNLQRLDPDRHRRRLEVLAELADAKELRARVRAGTGRVRHIKELAGPRGRVAS